MTSLTNQVDIQRLIPSTDVIQLTLTLKMTTARVVETSVVINNNSPIQDSIHQDNHTQPTYKYYVEQSVLGRAGRKESLAQ